MFGKKSLAKKMLWGVNIIKLTLYKTLVDDFSKKYRKEEEQFYKKIAAAMINEIYGCHNEISRPMFDENKKIIESELKNIGKNHSDLKQTITDSLRVSVQAEAMIDPEKYKNNITNITNLFSKAIKYGFFIEGGENPNPQSFLDMAEKLGKQNNVLK